MFKELGEFINSVDKDQWRTTERTLSDKDNDNQEDQEDQDVLPGTISRVDIDGLMGDIEEVEEWD